MISFKIIIYKMISFKKNKAIKNQFKLKNNKLVKTIETFHLEDNHHFYQKYTPMDTAPIRHNKHCTTHNHSSV